MDDELNSVAAALAASSATQRKWASVVLLGPLMPSMLAIMIIVVGGAVVKVIGFVAWNSINILNNHVLDRNGPLGR